MQQAGDEVYMRRALRLAALGRNASPNPMVGCVIVSPEGQVVGSGYHTKPGEPHAEIFALRAAGAAAKGATAYVNLEPCSHYGRTPPCALALLEAGIGCVVAAMPDPDPRVSGSGFELLRAGGIGVTIGVLETQARALNAAYVKHRLTGLPWVTLKTAMTLDGKIATTTGDSRWITSSITRHAVHRQLRDRCDAIITGIGTVLADDPALTTRLNHKAGRNPLRIVLDSRGRIPLETRIVRMAADDGKTLIVTTVHADPEKLTRLRDLGCIVQIHAADAQGQIDLPTLMVALGTEGRIISVLIESGSRLAAGFLSANLVDRYLVYLAPKIVGGLQAPGPVADMGIMRMADAKTAAVRQVRHSGKDIVIDTQFGEKER